MLLLKRKTFDVETDGPVVSSEQAALIARAEDIIAAAEAEAKEMAEKAKADYEAEKVRGYEDGLFAARQEVLEHKLNMVDDSMAYLEKTECRMGELVIKAMKKCIGEIGDRELVIQIVQKSMQAIVRAQRHVTIKVSTDMVPVVKERLASILAKFPSVAFAEVVEDSHLTGTACIVDTDAGSVETSIEGQLAAMEKSIRRSFERSK